MRLRRRSVQRRHPGRMVTIASTRGAEDAGRTARHAAGPRGRQDLAVEHGACIRPVQLRRTNLDTGAVEQVLVPCGHTLAAVCPACAERARALRAAQCREGWHLETEPVLEPDEPTEDQKWWVDKRAEAQGMRDQAASDGQDIGDLDELTAELDQEITGAGMRGNVLPARPVRRHRTTRRRQDAAPLPRRKIVARTVGKTYTAPDGKRFRPSMFVTLTCPSYGRSAKTVPPPTRPPTTTSVRPATRCTSRRCSTGSSKTCAASSVTRCSISRPSSRNGDWPRISIWPCGAPCLVLICGVSSRRPTTRCGGPIPPSSGSMATNCRCGMTRRPPTSTRQQGKSCLRGMTHWMPSATWTSRCMWPGSVTVSTRKACSQGPPRRTKLPDRAGKDEDPRGSGPRGSSHVGRWSRAEPSPGAFTGPTYRPWPSQFEGQMPDFLRAREGVMPGGRYKI